MTMPHSKYYRLFDDMTTDQRWYLDAPTGPGEEWLGTALICGRRYEGGLPLTSRVHHEGPELELTITEGTVPVVNERVAEIISRHARDEVQLIPLEVEGMTVKRWAVNTLVSLDCVDEERSGGVRRYTEEDERPPLAGKYWLIVELRIDSSRVEGHMIFRPRDWWVEVIVAGPLADDLVRAGVRCSLTPVS